MRQKKEDINLALVLLLLAFFIFLSLGSFASQTGSSSYNQNVVVTTGGDNLTSSSYKTTVVTSIINGIIESTSYINKLGFFHTWLLANNQPCASASQCEGGFCCSSLCKSSACPTTSPGPSGGGGSASGGGGGGGGGEIPLPLEEEEEINDFEASPGIIKEQVALGATKVQSIRVKNTGNSRLDFDLDVITINDFVFLSDDRFSLEPGEEKEIELNIIGKALGSYIGDLIISADGIEKEITLIVEVESEQVLFDAKVDIPSAYKTVGIGDELRAQITLLNVGPARKVDVTTTYLIKDKRGNLIYESSETFAVEKQTSYAKSFRITENFNEGDYLLVVELRYEKSFAVSSELFTVVESKPLIEKIKSGSSFTFLLLIAIGMLFLFAYVVMPRLNIFRKGRKR